MLYMCRCSCFLCTNFTSHSDYSLIAKEYLELLDSVTLAELLHVTNKKCNSHIIYCFFTSTFYKHNKDSGFVPINDSAECLHDKQCNLYLSAWK